MNKICFIIFVLFTNGALANTEIDSLIKQLDYHISQRHFYVEARVNRIEKLKSLKEELLSSDEQLFDINKKIMLEYQKFIFDSALHYLNENLLIGEKLNNSSMIIYSRLFLADLLATSGRFKESMDALSFIDRTQVPSDLLAMYFNVYRNVFAELSFNAIVDEHKNLYANQYQKYVDSLLQISEKGTEAYLSIIETRLRDKRLMSECIDINTQRFNMATFGTNAYAQITFERAIDYDLIDDQLLAKKFFILSALSDIQSSVKDNASLALLAKILYNEKDLTKAHEYIDLSFEDALFYNSKLRFAQISNVLPIINDAYLLQAEKQKKRVRTFLILISILSVVLFIAALLIYKQMKKVSITRNELKFANDQLLALNNDLRIANENLNNLYQTLSESNKVKEHYIGNFLSICSDYIDKLDQFRKMVNKYIANKQVNELYLKTKSLELIEEETQAFYKTFDSTFLHIFPNFVKRVNEILNPEEPIDLKNDELLNTELRIFALIRLGISDSNKIATLLRYSVRTIYNYRVKIKNRAVVERDNFEDYILKIGAFEKE